ncbi:DedA family protein [Streptomyces sp. NPDC052023]|uniref:DedA family protein n=1 Tax=Streptomyces sp. NPDC052023 TaxID=3365681 RepID=UPI0037D98CB7
MHVDTLVEAAGWWSYAVVFAVTASETGAFIGLLVPGETVILLASAMAGRGDLDVLVLAAVVVTGCVTGDNLGYALGRRCARHPARLRSRGAGRRHRNGRAQAFLVRHGGAAVFTGRFLGFVRTFLPHAAGAAGMPYRRFFLYSTAASLVWGIGNVLLGYFAGAATVEFLHAGGPIGLAVLAAATAAAYGVVRLRRRRGRRRVPPSPSRLVGYSEARRDPGQGPVHTFTHAQEQ